MNARLEGLVEATREALERRKRTVPLAELERAAADAHDDRPFAEALVRPGTSLIAEHKRRSPSAGEIRAGATCAEIVQAYERGGAAALSILTEEAHFGGSLDDLRDARAVTELPILRKDFTVDTYMLHEAQRGGRRRRAAGGGLAARRRAGRAVRGGARARPGRHRGDLARRTSSRPRSRWTPT